MLPLRFLQIVDFFAQFLSGKFNQRIQGKVKASDNDIIGQRVIVLRNDLPGDQQQIHNADHTKQRGRFNHFCGRVNPGRNHLHNGLGQQEMCIRDSLFHHISKNDKCKEPFHTNFIDYSSIPLLDFLY